MKIILTRHAKIRMEERGISREDIAECVARPARMIRVTERVCRFQKAFASGTLGVVAEVRGDYCIIITVYPL